MVSVKCKATDFSIDFEALSRALTPKTKVVIINSPNNPTGKVISAKELEKLSELLSAHEEKYGMPYTFSRTNLTAKSFLRAFRYPMPRFTTKIRLSAIRSANLSRCRANESGM